mmetsp:Transcript_58393/g.94462  ORF Transcript_58393/g.94462 Transcript_58393/m.94462 type:complete len:227 (-) Transcript_58393:171-851(-)
MACKGALELVQLLTQVCTLQTAKPILHLLQSIQDHHKLLPKGYRHQRLRNLLQLYGQAAKLRGPVGDVNVAALPQRSVLFNNPCICLTQSLHFFSHCSYLLRVQVKKRSYLFCRFTDVLPLCDERDSKLWACELWTCRLYSPSKSVKTSEDIAHILLLIQVRDIEHRTFRQTKLTGSIQEVCDIVHLLEWHCRLVDNPNDSRPEAVNQAAENNSCLEPLPNTLVAL